MSDQAQTIRARAPVRVDFAGGWTDVALFCREKPGRVVNAALNIYSHCTIMVHDRPEVGEAHGLSLRRELTENAVQIYSADFDIQVEARRIADLEFDGNADLVKAAIKRMDTKGGFSMITESTAPPGSGLGTSASMGVALLAGLAELSGKRLLRYELAEMASEIERIDLNIRGGKQDHYASAYGGVCFMEFRGEEVRACPLALRRDVSLELEQNLVLCYTGKSRLSGDIHEKVTGAFQAGEKDTVKAIEGIRETAEAVKNALLAGDLEEFGELLLTNWENQKRLHPSVTNEQINDLFELALRNGAIGGKACGAGGGGCLLLFCRPATKYRVRKVLREAGAAVIDFQFDTCGVETWRAG